jgi:hypothetical protein
MNEFKHTVQAYIDLHDALAANTQQTRELRLKVKAVSDLVLQFMKENGIDECELPTGGKLVRKTSKRTEGIKPEHIVNGLKSVLPVIDEDTLGKALDSIQGRREVSTVETLQRTKAKS